MQFRNTLIFKKYTHNDTHHKRWFPKVALELIIPEVFKIHHKDAGEVAIRCFMERLF